MAVYEHSYRPYEGPLTAAWSRFMVLPKYSYEQIVRTRVFLAFTVLCALGPFVAAVLIYLHHNITAIEYLKIDPAQLDQNLPINGIFFMVVLTWQGFLAFLLALFIGPSLVAPDLSNNGLALYLSRPFSRWEYLLGRFSTIAVLMSLIMWVPGLLLFAFQSFLDGWGWFSENLWIGIGLFAGSWLWIVMVSFMTLTASAWVRRKPLAAALVLAFFFVSRAMAGTINFMYGTWVGDLFNIGGLTRTVWARLFGIASPTDVPIGLAWTALIGFCGLCLLLLMRKVRAYQVVR